MKVIDLSGEMLELRGDAVELDPGQVATAVGWTPDGQLLTVATTVSCSIAGRMQHLLCRRVLHARRPHRGFG